MADRGVSAVRDNEVDVEMSGANNNGAIEIADGDDNDGEDDEEEDEIEGVPATQDETADDNKTLVPTQSNTISHLNPQTIFLEYLKSPIVSLEIGKGATATRVSAHRSILTRAPFFAERLSDDSTTLLSLPDEDLDAIGCFLQYQYTGEYFPRRIPTSAEGLETDPSLPTVDTTGAQLLKHARVYTLAEKLGLPDLKTLAHSKIHRINSTAVGEIAYARYVYGHTSPEDFTIRRPVAAFWATRSHVLRHEAEHDFRTMCLEFPQFGFDVLSLVLDAREKRHNKDREEVEGSVTTTTTPQTTGKGRKRMRPSVNV